jgi:hypothetical protein
MSRFYLHQFHDGECIPDFEGEEFASIEAVRAEAVLAAREIMADRMIKGEEPDHSRFEVKDDEGRIVLVFPFLEALSNHGAE